MVVTNPGETAFDRYCATMGYEAIPITTTMTKTSDRRVQTPAGTVVVEVEGFEVTSADRVHVQPFLARGHEGPLWGAIDFGRLDNAVRRARRQLDRPEYAGLPCVVVLMASPYVDTSDLIVQAVLHAHVEIEASNLSGKVVRWSSNYPGRLGQPGASVISAVAVLDEVCPDLPAFLGLLEQERKHVEREEGVTSGSKGRARLEALIIRLAKEHRELDLERREPSLEVYENEQASVPLPRTIFCGKYDRRWGMQGSLYQEITRP